MKNNNLINQAEPDLLEQVKAEDQALTPHKTDWLSVAQFGFSTLVGILLLGIFLVSTLVTLLRDGLRGFLVSGTGDISTYLFAAGLGFAGLLMIPSAVYSGQRLFGRKPPAVFRWEKLVWMSYLFPLLILLGFTIQNGPAWSWGFLPLIHVLANGLGILWLLSMARRKLPDRSASRVSGSLVSGLALTPLISFILEIILLVGIALLWVVIMQTQPDFRQDLLDLATRLQSTPGNPQVLERALGRFAARPGVIISLLVYVAVLIPVIEEALKPLAVWFLMNRKLQPWEGFISGATAGAGYALFENLAIGSRADMWTTLTVSRLGTAAVHILTTGLVGWGLASAFTDKKYGRLISAFLTAVGLHGVWNALNILTTLGDFPAVSEQLGSFVSGLATYGPAGLVLLALGSLAGLIRANSFFRRAIMAQIK